MQIEDLLKELQEAKFPIYNEEGKLFKYLKILLVENVEEHGGVLITLEPILLGTSTGERLIKYYKEYLEEQKDK